MVSKRTSKAKSLATKKTYKEQNSTNSMSVVWRFDEVDVDGPFRFDVSRDDFDCQLLLDKMVSYSKMSWQDIIQQTHDRKNKSKNHYLDINDCSEEAQQRVIRKCLQAESDAIFSFALNNLVRLIGIKRGNVFSVIWYDAKHEFYKVTK